MKRPDIILSEYYVSCLTAECIRGELSQEAAQQISTLIKFGLDSGQVLGLLFRSGQIPPVFLN